MHREVDSRRCRSRREAGSAIEVVAGRERGHDVPCLPRVEIACGRTPTRVAVCRRHMACRDCPRFCLRCDEQEAHDPLPRRRIIIPESAAQMRLRAGRETGIRLVPQHDSTRSEGPPRSRKVTMRSDARKPCSCTATATTATIRSAASPSDTERLCMDQHYCWLLLITTSNPSVPDGARVTNSVTGNGAGGQRVWVGRG